MVISHCSCQIRSIVGERSKPLNVKLFEAFYRSSAAKWRRKRDVLRKEQLVRIFRKTKATPLQISAKDWPRDAAVKIKVWGSAKILVQELRQVLLKGPLAQVVVRRGQRYSTNLRTRFGPIDSGRAMRLVTFSLRARVTRIFIMVNIPERMGLRSEFAYGSDERGMEAGS